MAAVASQTLPIDLLELTNWVGFRTQWGTKQGKRKLLKFPLAGALANDSKDGKTKAEETWRPFSQACELVGNDRDLVLGFALPRDRSLTGIDLDHCLNADGSVKAWATPYVARFHSRTYIERTPSGEGLRIWVRATKPGEECIADMPDGGQVEVYDHARMFTVTGDALPGSPQQIAPMQDELDELYAHLFQAVKREESPAYEGEPAALSLDDEQLLMHMRNQADQSKTSRFRALFDYGDISGYGSASQADQALANDLAYACGPNGENRADLLFQRSGLMREKWNERHAGDGRTYGEITIATAYEGKTQFLTLSRPRTSKPAAENQLEKKVEASESAEVIDLAAILAENARLKAENATLREACESMNEKQRQILDIVEGPGDQLSPVDKLHTIELLFRHIWADAEVDAEGFSRITVEGRRDEKTKQLADPRYPGVADRVSVSGSTTRKSLETLFGMSVYVKKDLPKEITADGHEYTPIAIARGPMLMRSAQEWVRADGGRKKQGGARPNAGRKRKCEKCGSENLRITERTIQVIECDACHHVVEEQIGADRPVLNVVPAEAPKPEATVRTPQRGRPRDLNLESRPPAKVKNQLDFQPDVMHEIPADILQRIAKGPICNVCYEPKRRIAGGFELTCQCGRKAAVS